MSRVWITREQAVVLAHDGCQYCRDWLKVGELVEYLSKHKILDIKAGDPVMYLSEHKAMAYLYDDETRDVVGVGDPELPK